ncbi:MAG: glycosyltransferase [Bacteroidota bacterium]|nr:glycosyltransferase [Bacteroidota bacterium]
MSSVSIIISFYNNIHYLKILLAGFDAQSFKDFEVIIADDGSRKEVIKQLDEIKNDYSFPIKHIWHEDKGFRKNKIYNRAIMEAGSGYLIFVDGDCVPHKDFVKEHFLNKENNCCLTGRRVNLSGRITIGLTPVKVKAGYLDRSLVKLFMDSLLNATSSAEKGIYIKNKFLRKLFNKKKRGLLGCNMSIHKEDVLAINGFDERYEAPSIGEDTDIQYRLELAGVKIKSLNNIAIQYHLYHKLLPRPQENLDLFEQVKKERRYFTPYGIKKT